MSNLISQGPQYYCAAAVLSTPIKSHLYGTMKETNDRVSVNGPLDTNCTCTRALACVCVCMCGWVCVCLVCNVLRPVFPVRRCARTSVQQINHIIKLSRTILHNSRRRGRRR